MQEQESERIAPLQQEFAPRCPACAAFPKLAALALKEADSPAVTGVQESGGERVWDD